MTHISMDMQSRRFSKGVGEVPSTACKDAAMDYKGVPKCEQAVGKKWETEKGIGRQCLQGREIPAGVLLWDVLQLL